MLTWLYLTSKRFSNSINPENEYTAYCNQDYINNEFFFKIYSYDT